MSRTVLPIVSISIVRILISAKVSTCFLHDNFFECSSHSTEAPVQKSLIFQPKISKNVMFFLSNVECDNMRVMQNTCRAQTVPSVLIRFEIMNKAFRFGPLTPFGAII